MIFQEKHRGFLELIVIYADIGFRPELLTLVNV
jgi:hypothetical protein